ncbi:cellulose binding domain-containing protein [Actinocorallia lasiicapitis]
MSIRQLFTAAVLVAASVTFATPAQAAGVTASFTKVSDWGSGFEGKYTITNGTSSAVNGWNVQFDLPAGHSIGSAWDAQLARSGQHYTFTNPGWQPALAAGATVTFGFNGTPGGLTGTPANCTINGASCGGGGTGGAPGTPGVPAVTPSQNSAAVTWGAATGAVTGYRLYEGGTVKATVSGTSATVGGLAACSTHTYDVTAYNAAGESPHSQPVTFTTTGCTTPPGTRMAGAPYLYLGWGDPPNPVTVMNATGIKAFTMAFMLSGGGCTPAWDGQRPLTSAGDVNAINAIKAAGGDVQISFGGWQGNKLGPNCASPAAFAAAVQQVIDAYHPLAVDFDIENTDELENTTVQDRILGGLKIVKQNNPNTKVVVTVGTSTTGPGFHAQRLITQAKATGVTVDNWTLMPFDFGGGADMYGNTVNASEGLKTLLKSTFGWDDATAYSHMGISGMNGLSDQQELTSLTTWTQIRDWAASHNLGRLAFWSVNRDRPCPGGGVTETCSGISQPPWSFTQLTATF